jgi:hypothetical protein
MGFFLGNPPKSLSPTFPSLKRQYSNVPSLNVGMSTNNVKDYRIDDENNDVHLEVRQILGNRHYNHNHPLSSTSVANARVLISLFLFCAFKNGLEVISEKNWQISRKDKLFHFWGKIK